MNRPRSLPPVMEAPTHSHPAGAPCFVANECAIHTVSLPEGHFAAIVTAQEGKSGGVAIMSVLDRGEVEEHMRLLRNAMEDAERLDAGKPTIHAGFPPPAPPTAQQRLAGDILRMATIFGTGCANTIGGKPEDCEECSATFVSVVAKAMSEVAA
jgi:hypothetical protein